MTQDNLRAARRHAEERARIARLKERTARWWHAKICPVCSGSADASSLLKVFELVREHAEEPASKSNPNSHH